MKRLLSASAFACAIGLAGCAVKPAAVAPAPPARLAGSAWLAEDIDGKGVVDRVQSTIEFIDDERVAGNLACNRYSGRYAADASGLKFGELASTRRMCPPALMEQEGRFNAVLAATRGLRFDTSGALVLLDADGRTRSRLMPQPAKAP